MRRSLCSAGAPAGGVAERVSAIVAVVLAAVRRRLPDTPPAAGGRNTVVGPLDETVPEELETTGGGAVGTGVGVGTAIGGDPDEPAVPPPPPPQPDNAKTAALRKAPRT